jgi:Ni/Co efflux regulator RcnB
MVPVPAQHVTDIMQRVIRLVQLESLRDWDEDDLRAFFTEADEPTRSLVSYVARASMMGKPLTDAQAADAIQLSQRETATIMRDANERSREMNHPSILLLRGTTETLPNGRTVELRLFVMPENVAKMIRTVERELHSQESHHLLDEDS